MSRGSLAASSKKLNQLRGQKAKLAEDARVLAQTAILASAKDKEFIKDIHVPSEIPDNIADIIRSNNIEDATVVFGQNALHLFSYVFGQAVKVSIEEAMESLEKKLQGVVEQKIVEAINGMSASLLSALSHLKGEEDNYTLFATEFGTKQPESPLEDDQPVEVVTKKERSLGLRYGSITYNVYGIMMDHYPRAVSSEFIMRKLEDSGYNVPRNIHSVLNQLCAKDLIHKTKRGVYQATKEKSF